MIAAAAQLLLSLPLRHLRLNQHRHTPSVKDLLTRRLWSMPGFDRLVESKPPELPSPPRVTSSDEPPSFKRFNWNDKDDDILKEIEPVISLAREILHSNRYLDGERLTAEDEQIVVEKLLAYHPNSEDKIGCGLDSIMVDRHPQFRYSRCFFVVRTDGVWTDFSYRKCLQQYIRDKYPSYAERFIEEHFQRRMILGIPRDRL